MKKRIVMTLNKETKGAVRYEEPTSDNPLYLVGTLYLRKAGLAAADAVQDGYPPKIVVEISTEE